MKKNAVLATFCLVFASNTLSAKVIDDYDKLLSIAPTYGENCKLKTQEQGENIINRLFQVKMAYKLKHECNINLEGNNNPSKAINFEMYVLSQIASCYSKSDAINMVVSSEQNATFATEKCKLSEATTWVMREYSQLLNNLPDQ